MTGANRDPRVRLVTAQLTGLLTLLWIDEDPGLTGQPIGGVLSAFAPAMQRLIEGD